MIELSVNETSPNNTEKRIGLEAHTHNMTVPEEMSVDSVFP